MRGRTSPDSHETGKARPGRDHCGGWQTRSWAAAADANDYLVYNPATGILSYDANANLAGGAIAIAAFSTKPVLSFNDFVVI